MGLPQAKEGEELAHVAEFERLKVCPPASRITQSVLEWPITLCCLRGWNRLQACQPHAYTPTPLYSDTLMMRVLESAPSVV